MKPSSTTEKFLALVQRAVEEQEVVVPCSTTSEARRLRYRFYSWRRAQRILNGNKIEDNDFLPDKIEVRIDPRGLLFLRSTSALAPLEAVLEATNSNEAA